MSKQQNPQNENEAEDKQIIESVKQGGSDLSKPMEVDFFISIDNEKAGRDIQSEIKSMFDDIKLEQDDQTEFWTLQCKKNMILTLEKITAIQKKLDDIANPYAGFCDGWGTFGNADE